MSIAVYMPELGESVTEGTVTRWLKNIGDTVAVDEPLVEVATDKVDTEIPSPVQGILLEVCAWEDDTIPVGGLLARIGDSSEASGRSIADTAAFDLVSETNNAREEEPEEETADTETKPENAPAEDTSAENTATDEKPDIPTNAVAVTLPDLGESVTEGVITHWCKQVGDTIRADEPLVEIATDKVDTEIPSPVDGYIVKLCAQEDDVVRIGSELALIAPADVASSTYDSSPDTASAVKDTAEEATAEPADTEPEEQKVARTELKATKPMPIVPGPQQKPSFEDVPGTTTLAADFDEDEESPEEPGDDASTETAESSEAAESIETADDPTVPRIGNPLRGSSDHSYISPLVRKMAADYDIDLDDVTGSGLGGRIRKQDIIAAAEEKKRRAEAAAQEAKAASAEAGETALPAPEIVPGTVEKASAIRQSHAKSALYATRNTAVVSQAFEVDLTKALRQLVIHGKEGSSLNKSLRASVAYVAVKLLLRYPLLNASYDVQANEITTHDQVHLSVGVDTPDGFISPVIHNAETMSTSQLTEAFAQLKEKVANDKLEPADLSGGTFTLESVSTQGMLWETPLVMPPQSAALSIGNPVQRPVVLDDVTGSSIAIRAMSYLTLSYDSCLINGPVASRFMAELKEILEDAQFLEDPDDADALS